LQHAGVFADDSAVDDLRIRRVENAMPDDPGGAVVTIRRIT
jgi:hypothetical protein